MPLAIVNIVNFIIGALFVLCYFFQILYLFIPFIIKMPKHKETSLHKFAILISARNEENVVGTLIDSIKAQDYPSELITTVLVADNCTDKTAEVARAHGAVVYERFDSVNIGKGYALDFVLKKLSADFGDDAFDAFIVFDADNILTKNYVTEVNKTYSDGYEVVTCYRNSKNYGDSWLSGGSGLWFIRDSRYLNGSRFRIGACPQVSGTGFLFSNKIKKMNDGGWPYHTLTEDYEFTCDCVTKGIKFGYCETAKFYDEQTVTHKQSWNQRLRWTKGGLQAFAKHWKGLVKGLFSKNFIACYDMLMSIAPAYVISLFAVFFNLFAIIGLSIAGYGPFDTLIPFLRNVGGAYFLLFMQSIVCTITEWKQIRAKWYKKILYAFTFPFFIFSFIPMAFIALFMKRVEWKPISHSEVGADEAKEMGEEAATDETPDATSKEASEETSDKDGLTEAEEVTEEDCDADKTK